MAVYTGAQNTYTLRVSASGRPIHVLVVEDQDEQTAMIKLQLERGWGTEVGLVWAKSFAEALVAVRAGGFDVVLADLTLPDAQGMEVISGLCQAGPEVPVIALVAGQTQAEVADMIHRGAQDYVEKNAPAEVLVRAIRYSRERKRTEQRILHMTQHDALTGLSTRGVFRAKAHEILQRRRLEGRRCVMFVLDLDRFKYINDTHGHEVGDQILRTTAERIGTCSPRIEAVGRLGGDEFGILVTPQDTDDVLAVGYTFLESSRMPHQVGGQELVVSASMGGSRFPDDAQGVEEMLRHADTALYRAKEKGRSNLQMFTAALRKAVLESLALEHRVRGAVERSEFVLHYQPQVDLRTNRVRGAEALLRWNVENPVGPSDFVPLLENSNLIGRVGEWVIEQACRQVASWKKHGLENFAVAVNVSGRQLQDSKFAQVVNAALTTHGVEPRHLELELTEGVLMDDFDAGVHVLHELKELGVSIALDDFGTGYSSLSYLHRLPIDCLKIDRSFVATLGAANGDAIVAKSILALCKSLGLTCVAEGVETTTQLNALRSMGCEIVQGNLTGSPCAADELIRLVPTWVLPAGTMHQN